MCTGFYWLFKWNMILTSSRQNNKLYGLSTFKSSTRYIFNSIFTIFLEIFCYLIPVLFQLFRFFTCEIFFSLIFTNWILLSSYSVDMEDFFFLDYPFIWFASITFCLQITIRTHNISSNSTGGTKYIKIHDSFLNQVYYSLLNAYVIKNREI